MIDMKKFSNILIILTLFIWTPLNGSPSLSGYVNSYLFIYKTNPVSQSIFSPLVEVNGNIADISSEQIVIRSYNYWFQRANLSPS
jgi:hypothetical protein